MYRLNKKNFWNPFAQHWIIRKILHPLSSKVIDPNPVEERSPLPQTAEERRKKDAITFLPPKSNCTVSELKIEGDKLVAAEILQLHERNRGDGAGFL